MPFPSAHSRLTILGDAYGEQEIWQTGLRLIGTTPPTEAEFVSVDAAVQAFLATTDVRFAAGHRYIGLKWAPQDVNGRYPEGEDAVEWLRPTPFSQGVSGGFPQIALVTSWRTARTRGYASNGRSYWPSVQVINANTGQFPLTVGTNVAAAAATLIAAINSSGMGTPAVMSSVGSGRVEPITGVRVGLVMDTQRRRREQLAESYTEVAEVPL